MVRSRLFVIEIFQCFVRMNEDQWIYDNIISVEVDTNEQNEDKVGVKS